jgi:hypothetical protein
MRGGSVKSYVIPVLAAAAVALGACKNGQNNARDTTGMPNNSAAGSVSTPGSGLGPGASTGAVMPGTATPGAAGAATPGTGVTGTGTAGTTTPMDTSRDTTRKRQP